MHLWGTAIISVLALIKCDNLESSPFVHPPQHTNTFPCKFSQPASTARKICFLQKSFRCDCTKKYQELIGIWGKIYSMKTTKKHICTYIYVYWYHRYFHTCECCPHPVSSATYELTWSIVNKKNPRPRVLWAYLFRDLTEESAPYQQFVMWRVGR